MTTGAEANDDGTAPRRTGGKVLLTAAGARMWPLLEVALPTFERYAAEHGYEVIVEPVDDAPGDREAIRRALWTKIGMLRRAAARADVAVWMDADAMFCRFDRDLAEDLPPACFQAFAAEQAPGRANPSTAVWALRGGAEARAFLDQVETIGRLDHACSDQAAVCRALACSVGSLYDGSPNPLQTTAFMRRTGWLPHEWNPVGASARLPGRVRHFPGLPLRTRLLRMTDELRRLEAAGVV